MPLTEPTRLVLRKGWQPMDADAAAYISAMETADGQALEEKVKIAIDNFVLGCKADGIWDAIKASCILAGARTLAGALVPLAGTAPTNYNFVAGDYDRKTGLVGDGSTKYLNSNRNNNADPQDSFHLSCWNTTAHNPATAVPVTSGGSQIGAGTTNNGTSNLGVYGGSDPSLYQTFVRNRTSSISAVVGPTRASITFQGTSRSNSANYTIRAGGVNYTETGVSQAPLAGDIFVFGRNDAGSLSLPSNSRIAFYSIGEFLDLALLDARVTDLITAFGAAIP